MFFLLLLLITFSFSACGKRGKPLPPSLVVAEKITDLRLVVKPGVRKLAWSIPKKNSDGSKPVDLIAFKIRLKKVARELDSCRFCDEGFFDYKTINLLKPETGQQAGATFYLPVPEIEPDFVYVFAVVSLNSRGWSSEVSNKLALFALPQILPPAKVVLTPTASVVEISWQVPKLPADFTGKLFYRVYRRQPQVSGSRWKMITPTPLTDTHFIDVGLNDWHAYDYVITAVVNLEETSRESNYSKIVQIVPGDYTAPEKLENFSAFNYQAGIQLLWDPSSASDLAGYKVYRRDEVTGLEKTIAVLPPAQSEYFDLDLVKGRTYYYRVTAFDSSDRKNEGEPSPQIAVKYKP